MMQFASKNTQVPAPCAPAWSEAQVAVVLEAHAFLLSDGRVARQALSCVVTPEVGDRVLAASVQDGAPFIVHLLQRSEARPARLSVPGAPQLTVAQDQIVLAAAGRIALHALRDIELTAATGVLGLNGRNVFMTATDSLVQNTRHFVGKAGQYLLDVKHLLRLHGRQAMLTAEQDIKVDAERISMG